jgi:HEAT repeat protein
MSHDPHDDSDPALALLRNAVARQDGGDLARALPLVAPQHTQSDDLAPVLAQALEEPWHELHEDIARTLQLCRDPRTVPALARGARTKHPYLAHDDSHAFARKCIWALADVGTPEAHAHLQELAQEADPEVAGYARRRLTRWNEERERKGA